MGRKIEPADNYCFGKKFGLKNRDLSTLSVVARPRRSRVSSKKTFRTTDTDYTMLLVTDRTDLTAETIAIIYRYRWQIELFFRWFIGEWSGMVMWWVNIKNFPTHKSLIAYAGLDPTVFQSGKFEGTSRISKRGNRHLRRIIYLMTIGVIRCNAFFKAYFLKRRKNGLPFRKEGSPKNLRILWGIRAVLATAHKLLRIIFAMLSHKTLFRVKEVNSL